MSFRYTPVDIPGFPEVVFYVANNLFVTSHALNASLSNNTLLFNYKMVIRSVEKSDKINLGNWYP